MTVSASAQCWKKSAGALTHHPAFILGNGPMLPQDLSPLDEFFTVGVNRIWWAGYDPTVVMWTDLEIEPDISRPNAEHPNAVLYKDSQAIVFARDEINQDQERANNLVSCGNSSEPCHEPLNDPSMISSTGNMGTAAAFWAMSLGCRPIYILGMSGEYATDVTGEEQTNFFGRNPAHIRPSKIRMVRALSELLAWDHVFPVPDQETLNTLAEQWKPMARGRQWYAERFRASFCSGQLAETAG